MQTPYHKVAQCFLNDPHITEYSSLMEVPESLPEKFHPAYILLKRWLSGELSITSRIYPAIEDLFGKIPLPMVSDSLSFISARLKALQEPLSTTRLVAPLCRQLRVSPGSFSGTWTHEEAEQFLRHLEDVLRFMAHARYTGLQRESPVRPLNFQNPASGKTEVIHYQPHELQQGCEAAVQALYTHFPYVSASVRQQIAERILSRSILFVPMASPRHIVGHLAYRYHLESLHPRPQVQQTTPAPIVGAPTRTKTTPFQAATQAIMKACRSEEEITTVQTALTDMQAAIKDLEHLAPDLFSLRIQKILQKRLSAERAAALAQNMTRAFEELMQTLKALEGKNWYASWEKSFLTTWRQEIHQHMPAVHPQPDPQAEMIARAQAQFAVIEDKVAGQEARTTIQTVSPEEQALEVALKEQQRKQGWEARKQALELYQPAPVAYDQQVRERAEQVAKQAAAARIRQGLS